MAVRDPDTAVYQDDRTHFAPGKAALPGAAGPGQRAVSGDAVPACRACFRVDIAKKAVIELKKKGL